MPNEYLCDRMYEVVTMDHLMTQHKISEELEEFLDKCFREADEHEEVIVISSQGKYRLSRVQEDDLTDSQLDMLHKEASNTLREGTGIVYTKGDIDKLRDDL